ncbi:hypothetical protein ACJZ2D_006589 [Fusarium nematophilum]
MIAFWPLVLLAAAAAYASDDRPRAFCGSPDDSDYTLIQDPFFGDKDVGQPGITLQTMYGDSAFRWFMIASNTTVFIDLTSSCRTFAGRLVRGADINFDGRAHNLGTWAQFNWEDHPRTYGGVSVIEGNDGPVILQSEDEGTPLMGFAQDIVPAAPQPCKILKDSNGVALRPTDKNGYDAATRAYTMRVLDFRAVSIHQGYSATVMSHSGRFRVLFLHGYH